MPVSSRLLSGAPFDVKFISFDDIKADPHMLDGMDVLINVGDGDTAHTGGIGLGRPGDLRGGQGLCLERGGGLIGVGEPGGHQYQGRIPPAGQRPWAWRRKTALP